MSFFIIDIFPYLKKEAQKKLEIQLKIVLRDKKQYQSLKNILNKIFKEKFVPKLKEILLSKKEHLIKQIFLEGGFIEKEYAEQYPFQDEIPIIDFQNYYYLPNEIYYSILYDPFFQDNHYLIGFLSNISEKELNFWYIWQKEVTELNYNIQKPLKKNLISFYFFVLLNPITLPSNFYPKKEVYGFNEIFDKIHKEFPLCLYLENNFSFYQALRKLYFHNDKNLFFKIDDQKVETKELLTYFLCGKLIPLFKNNKIEKICFTKELRDVEINSTKKVQNLIYFNHIKKI